MTEVRSYQEYVQVLIDDFPTDYARSFGQHVQVLIVEPRASTPAYNAGQPYTYHTPYGE